jgi:TetR/AcrR family transcriptional regulator, upper aerobic nicotinate degradation pathway regulator
VTAAAGAGGWRNVADDPRSIKVTAKHRTKRRPLLPPGRGKARLQTKAADATSAAPSVSGSARRVGRPPLEAPNEERRNQIAANALELFSKFGYSVVSNRQLGEAAGINPTLIYHYFEDKDDLFQFVVRKSLADALAVYEASRPRDGAEKLGAWLSSNLMLAGDITRFLKVVLDYAHSSRRSDQTDDAIAHFYNTETGILAEAIAEECGVPRSRAADLANVVSVFLDGVMVARVVRPALASRPLIETLRQLLLEAGGAHSPGRNGRRP